MKANWFLLILSVLMIVAGFQTIIEGEFRNIGLTDKQSYVVGGGMITFGILIISFFVKKKR